MRPALLRLHNWVCFQGHQDLALDSKAYAVVARYTDDPRRSNWGGKSTLLEAIHFALYGEHRWTTEDSWITRGEVEGGVSLTLDNGITIERCRQKGTATRLTIGKAKGEEAQLALNELIGLDKTDFKATCYFEQKRMSRFIVAKPSDRMDTVVAWLRLEKLEACIDSVSATLSRMVEGVALSQSKLQSTRAAIDEIIRQHVPPSSVGMVDASVALQEARVVWEVERERLTGTVARLEGEQEKLNAWEHDRASSVAYTRIVDDGKRLKEQLASVDIPSLEKAYKEALVVTNEALIAHRVAERELRTKLQVARGQFDGACPVAQLLCPATQVINGDRKRNADTYEKARQAEMDAKEGHGNVERVSTAAFKAWRAAQDIDLRLSQLRTQAKHHREAAERFATGCPLEDPGASSNDLKTARDRLGEATANVRGLESAIGRLRELLGSCDEHTRTVGNLQHEVDVAREALLVFKRARQRIAEQALSEIEFGANGLLSDSAIDLTITARWQREGGGLADNCDSCGAPFGKSARIKVCSKCGDPRGPKMVNKLELILSNVSGAAEDLGGGAFQLSASAWLRADRNCEWSCALIDEPFASCDEANRDAFAKYLANMLHSGCGFNQSLVVAHSVAAMDALPGRIEIVSDGRFSRATVVA